MCRTCNFSRTTSASSVADHGGRRFFFPASGSWKGFFDSLEQKAKWFKSHNQAEQQHQLGQEFTE